CGVGTLRGGPHKDGRGLGASLHGVGFMYPQGYFHQRLSVDGRQEAVYEHLDRAEAPLTPALTPEGKRCLVAVPIDERHIYVQVWHVRVGRASLYLMDTDVEENAPWDRELSARLYGGGPGRRILPGIIPADSGRPPTRDPRTPPH